MIAIEESWRTIERVLEDVVPEVARTLQEGATEAEVSRLEKALGLELPRDFRASLQIHNGQNDPSRLHGLFNYNILSPIDQIISDYEMHRDLFADEEPIHWLVPDKIQNRVWAPGWIKFSEAEGDGFVLDMSPAANGTVGQVFYGKHDDNTTETKADSFSTFLCSVADFMDRGQYEVDDGIIVIMELW